MKKLFLICMAAMFGICGPGCVIPQAANEKFESAVKKLMDASFQSDSLGLIAAIENMKPFSKQNDLAPLAHYYIAFGKWQSVLRQLNISPGAQDAIQLLREAVAGLDTAVRLQEGFADAYALSLNCHFALFYLDLASRAELIQSAAALRKKALELEPNNPRVVLTDAQNIFYTPEQFGGSQEKGIARYKQAIQLFANNADRQTPTHPAWGLEVACAWLGNAYLIQKQPNLSAAKEAFEKALALRPDFAWVKETMLPQVEKRMQESAPKSHSN